MKENFTIPISNSVRYPNLGKIIACLILSLIIIYPVLGIGSIESIFSLILLFLILYVIISSMTNSNLYNELPSTLYPNLPHLGLDGISLDNYVAGMDVNKNNLY